MSIRTGSVTKKGTGVHKPRSHERRHHYKGYKGYSGHRGYSGYSGYSGHSGYRGYSGYTGYKPRHSKK